MTKNTFDISLEELAAAGKAASERADAEARAAGLQVAGREEEPVMSATVLTLGAHLCKWPIGDPALESYRFCGRRAKEGPYCAEHAQMAYEPALSSKKAGRGPRRTLDKRSEPRRA